MYKLIFVDSIEGDIIIEFNGKFYHVRYPYSIELDGYEFEAEKLSYFKYDHKPNLEFLDYLELLKFVDKIYLDNKKQNEKFVGVKEVYNQFEKLEHFLIENTWKDVEDEYSKLNNMELEEWIFEFNKLLVNGKSKINIKTDIHSLSIELIDMIDNLSAESAFKLKLSIISFLREQDLDNIPSYKLFHLLTTIKKRFASDFRNNIEFLIRDKKLANIKYAGQNLEQLLIEVYAELEDLDDPKLEKFFTESYTLDKLFSYTYSLLIYYSKNNLNNKALNIIGLIIETDFTSDSEKYNELFKGIIEIVPDYIDWFSLISYLIDSKIVPHKNENYEKFVSKTINWYKNKYNSNLIPFLEDILLSSFNNYTKLQREVFVELSSTPHYNIYIIEYYKSVQLPSAPYENRESFLAELYESI